MVEKEERENQKIKGGNKAVSMKHILNKKESQFLNLIFISSFFAFGLFHEYMACIFCGIFGLFFLYLLSAKNNLLFYINTESISIGLLVICYLPAAFYGIDMGMGWIGFLKMLTVLFFLCCAMQLTEEEKEKLLGKVPLIGCIMTLAGILSYPFKPAYEFFFTADRLGGFFQYANVFALFCLIGCILLVGKLEKTGERGVKIRLCLQFFLLIMGILLSGSRSVGILAVVCGCLIAIQKRTIRMQAFAVIGIAIAAAFFSAYLTGNVQNIGRLFTASFHSSTLLGRILYAKDGLRQILLHPFGLGYLGYYFMESAVQTGVYSVRFIHNDYLQMALDIGIVPALLFVSVLGKNLFVREKKFENRLITAVMALHALVDFDLEFTAMWFLLILNLNLCHGKKIYFLSTRKQLIYKILAGALAAAGIYTGAAMIPRYLGNETISSALLPFYTEAQKEVLVQETDYKKAEYLAEKLLKQNAYVAEAYDILAMGAYQKNDYAAMSEYKKEALKLQRYHTEAYERYLILLSGAIEKAAEDQDNHTVQKLMKDVILLDRQRNQVKEATDNLAYKIRDIPDLTLSDEAEDYIAQIKRFMNHR